MARTNPRIDGSEEWLSKLFEAFSIERATVYLARKFDSFDSATANALPVDDSKTARENFKSARLLGFIKSLKATRTDETNKPVLVAAVEMKRDVTERSSRQVQFNFAKKIIQDAVRGNAAGLNGYPSQGLFFFYDKDGYFRLSLVSGEMDGKKFKFNSAKRQSFFIHPERPNNVAKRRLCETIATFADLKEAFSVETLTKEFYAKLYAWYEWAMKPSTGVTFPNDAADNADDRRYNNEAIIRLITRLMFTWFIRQRGIVPDELFSAEGAAKWIKGFRATSMEESNYYRCILQNLFFATLNCQPEKRGFVRHRPGSGYSDGYFVKTKYRYEKEFTDAKGFADLLKKIPFLNCALFDCLDRQEREIDGGRLLLFDGFSDSQKRQAHIPNGLFFDPSRGILPLFDTYEFTIDENNADDADVALDPELLGKVFENLLGAFNPETQETARNATGSFYTPREIVDYMVTESLKNYLKTRVAELTDEWLSDLFDATKAAQGEALPFGEEIAAKVQDALYGCKILDPACGSGAFPMGILHAMVRLFRRLDPRNTDLNERIIRRYRDEKSLPPDPLESKEERLERLEAIERQLKEGQHYPDYARKLYLIENCIYGVDIQPIAAQISKLRFFISLLCDQLKNNWNAGEENAGLLSLPNLEAKFVCANTLIALPKTEGELALATAGIVSLRQKLQENRHKIFGATTYSRKQKLKERDLELRDKIRETVRGTLSKPDKELIRIQRECIARYREERKAYEEPKNVRRKKAVQGDLFGSPVQEEIGYEEVDLNKPKRDEIDAKIELANRKIAAEEAKAQPANVTAIDKLADLVAGWDPYDQNAVSSFFDPKWMFNIENGLDIVIGNPPYVQTPKGVYSNVEFPYSEGKDKGKQNLYKVFIEAGYNFAKQHGYISFIVQSTLMGDMSAKFTRELLLTKTRIGRIIEFPKKAPTPEGRVFKGVLQGTCIVEFEKSIPNYEHEFEISISNDISTISHFTFERMRQKDVLIFYPEHYELPLIRTGCSSVVSRIKSVGHTIKEYLTDTAQGNINTIHLPKILSKNPTGAVIAKGAHIHRWTLDNDLFPCALTNETKRIFQANKSKNMILTQNISGTTDNHRINASPFECKDTSIVFLHSANILYLRSAGEMKFVTAVLNSALMDWIFRITSTNNHLNIYELVALPIPLIQKDKQFPIIAKVDAILAAKKADPNADTTAIEAEIDQLVYQLYELTPEEIAIIEGTQNPPPEPTQDKPRRTNRPAAAVVSHRDDDNEELE